MKSYGNGDFVTQNFFNILFCSNFPAHVFEKVKFGHVDVLNPLLHMTTRNENFKISKYWLTLQLSSKFELVDIWRQIQHPKKSYCVFIWRFYHQMFSDFHLCSTSFHAREKISIYEHQKVEHLSNMIASGLKSKHIRPYFTLLHRTYLLK